jgi:uncharacterized protein YlxW (UPF0749 family)
MEPAEELLKVISDAQDGFWIPLAVVSGMLTIILVLVLFIFKITVKNNNDRHDKNDKRHSENEELLKETINNQSTLTTLVSAIEERTKMQQMILEKLMD